MTKQAGTAGAFDAPPSQQGRVQAKAPALVREGTQDPRLVAKRILDLINEANGELLAAARLGVEVRVEKLVERAIGDPCASTTIVVTFYQKLSVHRS